MDVIGGDLLGGEGVHVAADRFDGLGDRGRVATVGAFEQEMLEEVAHAGPGGRFVAGPGPDPEPDGDGTELREDLGDHAQPRVQAGAPDHRTVIGITTHGVEPRRSAAATPAGASASAAAARSTGAGGFAGTEVTELVARLGFPTLLERRDLTVAAPIPATVAAGLAVLPGWTVVARWTVLARGAVAPLSRLAAALRSAGGGVGGRRGAVASVAGVVAGEAE